MAAFSNTMDVFKLLDKSNCRACNEKTCLAFAAAVFQGKKPLADCPRLSDEVLSAYGAEIESPPSIADEQDKLLESFKQRIRAIDLAAAAERTGGIYSNDKLVLKVFGKDFSVDARGALSSDIHINPWVSIPLLNYVLNCCGHPPTGQWVSFKELKNGKTWQGLFGQQCEKPLKKVVDRYPDLFADLMHIFNGRSVNSHQDADIALSFFPLPKVPMLIAYWYPEEDLGSDLHLFFDASAEANCSIEGIYSLGTGIVRMFEKLALRHGH